MKATQVSAEKGVLVYKLCINCGKPYEYPYGVWSHEGVLGGVCGRVCDKIYSENREKTYKKMAELEKLE